MAMMEHWCPNCGQPTYSNDPAPKKCPSCNYEGGGWDSYSDEVKEEQSYQPKWIDYLY